MEVSLYPGSALTNPSHLGGFTNPENILLDDGIFATYPASSYVNSLIAYNFSAGLPADIVISGIEVVVKAMSTSTNAKISAQLTYDKSTGFGVSRLSSNLTTTLSTYSIGGSADTFGATLKRTRIHGNTDFGVILTVSDTTAETVDIDYVYVKVYYTLASYLVGDRSNFPQEVDVIPTVYNGTGPEHRIRSEDVNKLGDCLYTIQTTVLATTGGVRSVGLPLNRVVSLFSITVTGTVSSSGSIHYQQYYKFPENSIFGYTKNVHTNITGLTGTRTPWASVDCDFVSAIGWVVNGATITPVHVSPRAFITKRDEGHEFMWGFVCVGQDIVSSSTSQSFQNHNGAYAVPANVPPGTLIVKLLAIGVT